MPITLNGDGAISGLTSTGISAVQKLPAGTVLQVVNATYGTQVTNSTTTYADTGLSATITPTSSTSKILVIINQSGVGKGAGDADLGVRLRILRDATAILTFIDRFAYTNSLLQITLGVGTSYLDSPSTTSAVTYKTQFACWNTSVASVFVQGASGNSTITLMEIAG
jgi:ethanolamine ammonia-lyase large subunit